MSRSSSFARSFFQTGEDEQFENDDDAAIAAAAAAIGGTDGSMESEAPPTGTPERGRAGMDRRKSRRRLSRGSGRSTRDVTRNAAGRENSTQTLPSAASASGSIDDADEPVVLPRPAPAKRQHSWYQDALLQGGGSEDLAAILGEDAPPVGDDGPVINNEEVLEQYRIMAHVEASIRVKENTGFDMGEYEQRRKMHPEPQKADYYTGKQAPTPKLPEPKRITPGSAGQTLLMKPQEPAIPTYLVNPSLVHKAFISRQIPELCPGVVMQGSATMLKGEHVVRCLGCQTKLRVNLLAMLVQCPDCSTVSPASSTRR